MSGVNFGLIVFVLFIGLGCGLVIGLSIGIDRGKLAAKKGEAKVAESYYYKGLLTVYTWDFVSGDKDAGRYWGFIKEISDRGLSEEMIKNAFRIVDATLDKFYKDKSIKESQYLSLKSRVRSTEVEVLSFMKD